MFSQRVLSRTQIIAQRLAAVLIFGVVVLAVVTAPAEAAVKRAYAGIVIDAKTGKTLYSRSADELRYPASVTKVMTLYVLFEELEAGRLTLNSKLSVSKHAAAAVPTKLGLKAGSTITVENAIKSLVTLSANDIARVIAENISGTESEFAVRMTRTAKALGMSSTKYRNASGLPDSGQVTTVRDQARLGVAIYQHFPKYYEYFQTTSFKYGSRTYGNHNRLLGKSGIDGIKTGYIRASGYNLLTAARKNGRHIVVAAFGYDSGATRNAKVYSLVQSYMPKARSGSQVAQARIAKPSGVYGNPFAVASATPVTPMPRPAGRGNSVLVQPVEPPPTIIAASLEEGVPQPEPRPLDLVPETAADATEIIATGSTQSPAPQPRRGNIAGAWISEALTFDIETNAQGMPLPPVAIGEGGAAIDLLNSSTVQQSQEPIPSGWVVQVGAAPDPDSAEVLLATAAQKVEPITNFRRFVQRFEKNGQTFYRARIAGFGDRNKAIDMCNALRKAQLNCLVMQS